MIKEIAETDVVTHLVPVGRTRWAYGLMNGTVRRERELLGTHKCSKQRKIRTLWHAVS